MEYNAKQSALIILIMMFGAFVGSLAQTLLAPALPTIMSAFNITASKGQWLTTVYLLVVGIMIPTTAYLINQFKTRTLFIASVGIFILGSIVAIRSTSFEVLLISRVLQAMGSGVLLPLLQVSALKIFPPEKRGVAMGIVGITVGFAPAVGPTLAGWLIDSYGWHSIFVATLILGCIDVVLAVIWLKNIGEPKKTKLDILSVILSTLGFGGLLIGASNQGQFGWWSSSTLIPLCVGILGLALFSYRQLRLEEPLLDISIFKYREFAVSTLLIVIVYASMMSATIIIPMYVQDIRGYSALKSGLLLLPGALLTIGVNPLAGKILDQYGPRKLCITGMVLLTIGNLSYIFLDESISLTYLSVMYGIRMIGITLMLMPLTAWGLTSVPQHKMSDGTAINNTLRQVAGAIGSAIFVSIMVKVASSSQLATPQLNSIHGISISFAASTCLAIIGLILSVLFIKDRGTVVEDSTKGVNERILEQEARAIEG